MLTCVFVMHKTSSKYYCAKMRMVNYGGLAGPPGDNKERWIFLVLLSNTLIFIKAYCVDLISHLKTSYS